MANICSPFESSFVCQNQLCTSVGWQSQNGAGVHRITGGRALSFKATQNAVMGYGFWVVVVNGFWNFSRSSRWKRIHGCKGDTSEALTLWTVV